MLVTDSGHHDSEVVGQLIDDAVAEFTAAGVGPGTAVVLCLPNDVRWVAAYLALARIGAVSVPLNAGSAINEIAHVLEDSGARLVLVPASMAAVLADRFPDRLFWPDGMATEARMSPGPDCPDEVATIAYTSGTTGRPRGVLQTRRAVTLGGRGMAERLRLTTGDVVLTALPLAHSYGTNVLNAALVSGATVVVLPRFDEAHFVDTAHRCGATVLAGVPTMYRRLLARPAASMPSLRCVVSAGQSAGADLALEWERSMGGAFVEGWGMTELAGFATLAAPDLPGRHGSVGTAVPGVRLRADTDGPFGDAGTGELCVAGPMVTPGHLGAADPVTGDGWLRTGDLGSIGADGLVRIVGRTKEIVLSGGFSVYPAEVERVVARHPDVADVAVAGLPDPVRGEITCAWIVPRAGARLTVARIAEFCRPHLAGYKVPRQIVVVPELPLSSTGKLLRRELPAPRAVGAPT
ncbi:class I adenylate-forming enzyme family protein [Nocardia sp. NPDC058176]|uniref:class I adenylate-forming enzyme family protein n=1 Tax=Nocardia sp. NPDC058176 TaxID=3346368 RepID=UPI0036DCA80B